MLFLIVGERQTAPAYKKADPFFTRPSNTPELLKSFLTRLWSCEKNQPVDPAQKDIADS